MSKPHENPADLFWKKVNKTDGCWLWTGKVAKDGYGQFSVTLPRVGLAVGQPTKQRHVRAHRYSWELTNGHPPPSGLVVLHGCDTPLCVRPDHLSVGTQLENRLDCKNKGRTAKGERSGQAKLSAGQVLEIRRQAKAGVPIADLAKTNGISCPGVYAIINRRTWAHLPEQESA